MADNFSLVVCWRRNQFENDLYHLGSDRSKATRVFYDARNAVDYARPDGEEAQVRRIQLLNTQAVDGHRRVVLQANWKVSTPVVP